MKRTKLMNIKYPHYYPVGLSGGNLCGLFIPPGIKTNNRILLFAYAYQLMFLIYGLSGNPLYDIQCYSIYFIVIGIVLSLKMNSDISLERADT